MPDIRAGFKQPLPSLGPTQCRSAPTDIGGCGFTDFWVGPQPNGATWLAQSTAPAARRVKNTAGW